MTQRKPGTGPALPRDMTNSKDRTVCFRWARLPADSFDALARIAALASQVPEAHRPAGHTEALTELARLDALAR